MVWRQYGIDRLVDLAYKRRDEIMARWTHEGILTAIRTYLDWKKLKELALLNDESIAEAAARNLARQSFLNHSAEIREALIEVSLYAPSLGARIAASEGLKAEGASEAAVRAKDSVVRMHPQTTALFHDTSSAHVSSAQNSSSDADSSA